MARRYIITIVAANRVGILAALTTALAELKGELIEICVTALEKFSTMMLAAEFPDDRDPNVIREHIQGVCGPFRADVVLKDPAVETVQPDPHEPAALWFLTCSGRDTPGIVRRLSGRLAEQGIDIADIYAARDATGDRFHMTMRLGVPPGTDIDSLQAQLAGLSGTDEWSAKFYDESAFVREAAQTSPRRLRLGY